MLGCNYSKSCKVTSIETALPLEWNTPLDSNLDYV